MNNVALAQSAYGDLAAPSKTARVVEYQAFARVTRRLAAAAQRHARADQRRKTVQGQVPGQTQGQTPGQPEGQAPQPTRDLGAFAELAEALAENQRLWTTLAADVAADANGLPALLRARLFYLSEFTTVHSRAVLHGKASAAALVEINKAVMAGLRGDTAPADAPVPDARPTGTPSAAVPQSSARAAAHARRAASAGIAAKAGPSAKTRPPGKPGPGTKTRARPAGPGGRKAGPV